jgi:hypothetical protein
MVHRGFIAITFRSEDCCSPSGVCPHGHGRSFQRLVTKQAAKAILEGASSSLTHMNPKIHIAVMAWRKLVLGITLDGRNLSLVLYMGDWKIHGIILPVQTVTKVASCPDVAPEVWYAKL